MDMKVPISNRLLLCAALVPPGSRAADIGTDHGYLAVHLLREGVCPFVTAADLREQPLQKARENAARFGVADRQRVRLQCFTSRPLVFQDVEVRVSPQFSTVVHIDYDEANACGFQKGDRGVILK